MQIVGYERSGVGSAVLVSDDGDVRRRSLESGTELDGTLGRRVCAGTIDGDVHQPCDRPTAPFCAYHTSTWVCATCTGTCLKDEMDCHETHAVYLAAFAPDTFKVGVTKRRRLETRLREQGADRAAHIRTVENGRIAREIEAEIARRLPDRVRTAAKIEGLTAAVDEDAWETLLAEYDVAERFDLEYGLDLETRPIRETIAAGTVVGLKGRLLVLEQGGTNYVVDLRDLVGYDLETGESDRSRQSSLDSFG
ncbi:DUF2797 domain-containing protein [Natrialbaceae archaeon AArc-T1-2]|uniref:DUF2797 domain-containing protein n=1 Tax=Natrialbaceae archaeon AArc-T1-2 TaxID=3053904 RepID=UPI00255A8049|nr:DUF2797 domain-containing protein [Natrialbaceae archaeon AArc-T1-2]WIV68699.1 DUF2797 domain-containing protein [Natrialbaceae archaeon AArc-T1-2]